MTPKKRDFNAIQEIIVQLFTDADDILKNNLLPLNNKLPSESKICDASKKIIIMML